MRIIHEDLSDVALQTKLSAALTWLLYQTDLAQAERYLKAVFSDYIVTAGAHYVSVRHGDGRRVLLAVENDYDAG